MIDILDAIACQNQKILLKNNMDKLKPCSQCGCGDFIIKRTINNGGKECFPYFCVSCGNRSPICEKKAIAESIVI